MVFEGTWGLMHSLTKQLTGRKRKKILTENSASSTLSKKSIINQTANTKQVISSK
jgi:hypothetical protein